MADMEKVIRGLECCLDYYDPQCEKCPYQATEEEKKHVDWDCHKDDLQRAALELLKEQEPIKPTVAVDTWICSKCGHRLESQDLIDDKENPQVLVHELYQYCPNCGRAVKWG